VAKRKKSTHAKQKDKAWKAFSRFIRLKYSDQDGICTCVTCDRKMPFTKIQAGHWIPGRTNAILFEEDCVHPQCYGCNVGQKGKPIEYWLWMEQNIGRQRMDEMIAKYQGPGKEYTVEDLKGIETYYKTKCLPFEYKAERVKAVIELVDEMKEEALAEYE
jgi:hypothetical protein